MQGTSRRPFGLQKRKSLKYCGALQFTDIVRIFPPRRIGSSFATLLCHKERDPRASACVMFAGVLKPRKRAKPGRPPSPTKKKLSEHDHNKPPARRVIFKGPTRAPGAPPPPATPPGNTHPSQNRPPKKKCVTPRAPGTSDDVGQGNNPPHNPPPPSNNAPPAWGAPGRHQRRPSAPCNTTGPAQTPHTHHSPRPPSHNPLQNPPGHSFGANAMAGAGMRSLLAVAAKNRDPLSSAAPPPLR